jgi:hypothetical protein
VRQQPVTDRHFPARPNAHPSLLRLLDARLDEHGLLGRAADDDSYRQFMDALGVVD